MTEDEDDGPEDPALMALLLEVARAPGTPPPDLTGKLLGPFRLESAIGRGGSAVVYEARDDRLQRQVAIKVYAFGEDVESAARAMGEARTLASLQHPNIAQVLDVGQSEGFSWVAMELLRGSSLRQCLSAGSFDGAGRKKVVEGLLAGLAAAHRAGVVHGDLKPENVVLDALGVPRLVDFGSALAGLPIGLTPRYAAPEVLAGGLPDFAADVYSLGCTLDEVLQRPRVRPRWLSSCLVTRDQRAADAGVVLQRFHEGRRRTRTLTAVAVTVLAACAVVGLAGRGAAVAPKLEVERLTAQPAGVEFDALTLSKDGVTAALVSKNGLSLLSLDSRQLTKLIDSKLTEVTCLRFWDEQTLVMGQTHGGATGVLLRRFDLRSRTWSNETRTAAYCPVAVDALRSVEVSESALALVTEGAAPRVIRALSPTEAVVGLEVSPTAPLVLAALLLRGSGGPIVRLELVPLSGGAPVVAVEQRGLVQEGGLVAATFDEAGNLLYATGADLPSQGSRVHRLRLDSSGRPVGDPLALGSVPGVAFSLTSSAGATLVLIAQPQTDVMTAPVLDDGGLGPATRLTLSDWTERASSAEEAGAFLGHAEDRAGFRASRFTPNGIEPLTPASREWTTWPVRAGKDVLYWRVDPSGDKPAQLIRASTPATALFATPSAVKAFHFNTPAPQQWVVQCPDDPRRCQLVWRGAEEVQRWNVDALSGSVTPETPLKKARLLTLARSGEQLASVDLAAGVLQLRTRAGGEQSTIPLDGCGLQFLSPGLEGQWWGSGFCDGTNVLLRLDARGVHRVLEASTGWVSQPVLSVDGRQLAWAQGLFDTDVYQLRSSDF